MVYSTLLSRTMDVFCISTNSENLFRKGKLTSFNKLTEDQKNKFKVEEYKIYKTVPYLVALCNQKMNSIDIMDQLVSSHEREEVDHGIYLHRTKTD